MARKDSGPRSMVRFIGRVIEGSKPGKHPGFVEPQLAALRTQPPSGDKYVHEIKFDGYRVQAHLRGGLAWLYTRSGLNWTKRFPTIAVAMGHIPATELLRCSTCYVSRMTENDPEIEHSPLCEKVTQDGVTVDVQIYRLAR